MKLSIIIPVYNEEKTIGRVLEKLAHVKIPGFSKEIIVVDDGSIDSTASILHTMRKSMSDLAVITNEKNKGKGMALRIGMSRATGNYIVIQDADMEYDPTLLPSLLKPISDSSAQVVFGTRLKRMPNIFQEERTVRFFLHYLGNRMLSLLTSILYGQWITDMETGYKVFPKTAVDQMHLQAKSFEFEPEITAKLIKLGYKIVEVPISTNPRGYKEGKKLNTFHDGFRALWALLKYRFTY